MKKIADEPYEFKGTRFHLRAFEDPAGLQKPVFVVEEAEGNQTSLSVNRVEMAKELAKRIGYNPDQIDWLEQSRDGSLQQVEFQYTHTDTLVPGGSDMDVREMQEAVRRGQLNTLEIDRYNTREFEVSRRDWQAQVGDALESYEMRQNREMHEVQLPAAVIPFEEMRHFPSPHDFENEPDLSY